MELLKNKVDIAPNYQINDQVVNSDKIIPCCKEVYEKFNSKLLKELITRK